MSRSLIMAILALAVFLVGNLTVYSFLSYRYLSERMVTEKLVEGLNEAMSVLNQEAAREAADIDAQGALPRQLVRRLRKYNVFHAIALVDASGRVLYREVINVQAAAYELGPPAPPERERVAARGMISVSTPYVQNSLGDDEAKLVLEYNAEAIRQEAQSLREEFERKLRVVILVSAAVLLFGGAYIFRAYRRNKELELAARKADRMAYVGTLSSGLAHEIRNPLNSMNMNVQLIQEELDELDLPDAEQYGEMLTGVRREIQRLERLVSSFLGYARPMKLEIQKCRIDRLIQDTLDFLEPEILKSGVALKTAFDAKLPECEVDEGQIKQALINVVQNAIQVLQPGELLEIGARRAGGDKLVITIRDEGPGIAEEELKHIFKVFYSSKRGGTGLGLPTAQRIAEMHYGGIKVDSQVGKGTKFTIILPLEHKQP